MGGNQAFAVDVRIICATHRNLSDMVQHRTFREDLYFRLNVIGVHVPPLRERSSDVLALGRHFLASQAAAYDEAPKLLSDAASEVLSAYHWPGNVRELANVMEHAHVLASGSVIQVTDLPSHLHPCQTTSTAMATASATLNIHQIERQTIVEALRRCEGNKAAAARMLGMNIQKLGRRMSRLSVDAPQVSLR